MSPPAPTRPRLDHRRRVAKLSPPGRWIPKRPKPRRSPTGSSAKRTSPRPRLRIALAPEGCPRRARALPSGFRNPAPHPLALMLAWLLRHPACVSPDRSLSGTTQFRADLSPEDWKVRFRPGLSSATAGSCHESRFAPNGIRLWIMRISCISREPGMPEALSAMNFPGRRIPMRVGAPIRRRNGSGPAAFSLAGLRGLWRF